MKSTAICPISNNRINEKVARGNAFLTVLVITAFLLTSNPILIILLLIDFMLRGLELSKYSPFAIISAPTVKILGLRTIMINAGPKLFAARIGILFSLCILVSVLSGINLAAYIFASVFGICAFLEAFFGYCIACRIYPFVYRAFYSTTN